MKHPFFSTTSLAASVGVLFALTACTANVGYPTGSGANTTGLSTSYATSASSSFMTVTDLVSELNAQGSTATLNGQPVQQPYFGATGQQINVNGQTVQVFQYSDAASAQADATHISSDGMSISGTQVSWAGPPHFFRKDNLIVLYIGSDQQMLSTLESALGMQIAGSNSSTGTTVGTGATMSTGTSATNMNSSY